jgi:hypothetical protein
MVLKKICLAIACMMLMGWSGLSVADEYRPGEFLGLDLPKALLSPKPLGPPATFAPGPLDVQVDRETEGAQASVEPKAPPKIATPKVTAPKIAASTIVVRKTRTAHAQMRAEKPRGAPRIRLARRHGNPLDAQAFDTRIQVWPCRSGGICNWKQRRGP